MGYSRGTSNYLERIVLSDSTHMSMANPVAICIETLRIDSRYSLKKEFIELIHMNLIMVIITNCVMSWLCMWSSNLRCQRHLVDGWSCFDYELRIPSHKISKMSYIGYNMKSTKMFAWSRWDNPPAVSEEIYSRSEMR